MKSIFITIFLVLLYSLIPCSFQYKNIHNGHSVVLDAGSTSIKVRIYKWWKDSKDYAHVPKIHLVNSQKIRTSLEKFAKQADMLELQLLNCVDKAVQYINKTEHHADINQIPLYLMSTAGSRTLSGHDARYYIKVLRRFLSNTTVNPFYFRPRHVQILSGEEEGVYSWLSLNYLLGFFNTTTGAQKASAGLLELGGGSTQISFIPHDPLYDGEFHIYISKRRYELYVHSYLNFGQSYIINRVNKWLLHHDDVNNSSYIPDPCRLSGDEQRKRHHNTTVTLYGTGNYTQCSNILHNFLRKVEDDRCSPKPCAIGSVYQPSVSNITFYAIGAFKYSLQELGALDDSRRLNITRLNENTREHCAKNISDISKKNKKYASEFCLMGIYISLLLTKAYGFNETTSNIIVSDKVHGHKTDWSLGVVLHEVMERNALSPHKPVVQIHCPTVGESVKTTSSSTGQLISDPFVLSLCLMVKLITFYHYHNR